MKDNLKNDFIKLSKALYGLPIFFIFKLNKNLRFYIDYRTFNFIIKKNRYLIPLIDKVLIRIINYKYFIRLDIIAVFNKLKILLKSENFITFVIFLKAFKYKIILFGLINDFTFY